MIASSKKTPVQTKRAADSNVKKVTTKKVASGRSTTSKSTAATTVKKTVAKPVAIKKVTKKVAVAKMVPVEAAPAKKPAAKKVAPKKKAVTVSPEQRYQMIATAAYFLAERRGFARGYAIQDWISAEAEIDAKFNS